MRNRFAVEIRDRWPDLGMAVALLALAVVFFWKIALTNLILAGVDVFTYFTPFKAYAAEVLRAGRLPLWNPYLFMGVPFLVGGTGLYIKAVVEGWSIPRVPPNERLRAE
ncbi:MAG TPA: hypothetical protein EYP49_10480, partial [Anaerolineae bacterium]|nr:hypothetical protein [Anaerolineae bacterium]